MSTSSDLASRIAAGAQAVGAQTALLHREFGKARSHWKADGTRVTPVDLAISENIFQDLRTQFPGDQFFSEESTHAGAPEVVTARFCWVLDPIDGTNNYALGIPHCAIGLALLEHGNPIYGFVYDLARRVLIQGGPGCGVQDGDHPGGQPAPVLSRQSVIGFHSPYEVRFAPHAAILAEHFKIRGLGSSTIHLAYVGAGLFDGVVDHNVKVWDIAAAVPLVLAAGGVVDYISPAPFPLRAFDLKMGRTFYLAGSREAVAQLRRLLGV
ncbi:MAG: inositol monophosphatase family protein [Opitutales bacterium]